MIKEKYFSLLGIVDMPIFLEKYLKVPSLVRLKKVGYFCGMDFASKYIYDFKENISRYDHSLSTALLTWKFTHDKKATLAALFHDISTPCFSHVIDYMNKDYSKQESTEEKTKEILFNDKYLIECLYEDGLVLDDISDFKKFSIVDLERPKLCADRIDGVILTGLYWTQTLTIKEVDDIIKNIMVYINEDSEKELGFKDSEVVKIFLETNNKIDIYCHSVEDNYMMELLAEITREGISKKYFSYNDLYILDEEAVFKILLNSGDKELLEKVQKFQTIKKEDILHIELPEVKKRIILPIVRGERIKKDK